MKKIINAFFSGTGFKIDSGNFLTAKLHQSVITNEKQRNFGFNGCGVDYGVNGSLWGTGLDNQCQEVIRQVRTEIEAGNTVRLNAYGHSRGAVGALLLAKQLSKVDPKVLEINLALLDPVPGNYITTSRIDFLNISLANKTQDLSDCMPLKTVLALYPYEPLPDVICHAPLLPSYPKHAKVDVDVIPGCHAQTEQFRYKGIGSIPAERIYDFLENHGTQFLADNDLKNYQSASAAHDDKKQFYRNQVQACDRPIRRSAHSSSGAFIEVSNDPSSKSANKFFNRHHQRLEGVREDNTTLIAKVSTPAGFFSRLKETLSAYPKTMMVAKWCGIGLGLTAALCVTGGFSSIPLLAAVVSNIGLVSAVALTGATLGLGAALVWSQLLTPALLWGTSRFYYPNFEMADIKAPKANDNNGSSVNMVKGLGVDPSAKAGVKASAVIAKDKPMASKPTQGLSMLDMLRAARQDDPLFEIVPHDLSLSRP